MFDDFSLPFDSLLQYGFISALLLGILLLIRVGLQHFFFNQANIAIEVRRRWSVNVRNALVFIFLVGMILIWAPQLRTFAVAFFAVALALVIAVKEFLDCMVGAAVRAMTKSYAIGDRIEIEGVRGNVVDHNLLTTTLLEIGPGQTSHQYTGRAMVVPNSFLLKYSLMIETYSKHYRLHIVTVPLSAKDDWKRAESILLKVAEKQVQPFIEEARQHLKKLEGKKWLDAPNVDPRVTIQMPDPGRINLLLRIPCPTQFPSRLEQAILRKFLEKFTFAV
ncbi:MAG: mechanosensitive ion channel family protein [Nitrospirae bacterium]|nr:mechanosensitive ion channel family protein [Nitrospirota bacterium]MDA1302874.1 mechanosensitive ion channel family protein [Nitrospirota bacterium]